MIMKTIQTTVIAWAMIILGFLSIGQKLLAQNEAMYQRGMTQAENILPPSPEAASAVKYADVPFTHSLGAAEYYVPLYEIKGRQLSIPIGLSYQSNGIKVDDIAGVAGLGWSLKAGGVISREVIYMPDEFNGWSFYEHPTDSLHSKLNANAWNYETETYLTRTLWHQRDRSSDRYSYTVGDLSGSFIITPGREVVQLSGSGVIIQLHQESYTGPIMWFTIIGPDGTRYVFSERETSTRINQRVEFPSYSTGQEINWSATTAWYLTSITTADGTENASFTYSDGGEWIRDITTTTQNLILYGAPTGGLNLSQNTLYPTTFAEVESRCTTRVLASVALKGITASFNYAVVNSQTEHLSETRPALHNHPRRLNGMSVYSTSGAELVRYDIDTYREPNDGRILLRKVEQYHANELSDRWTFSYKTLGNKIYRWSQDWFGYYNDENKDDGYTFSINPGGTQNPDGSYTEPGPPVVIGPDPDDPGNPPIIRPRSNLSPYKIDKNSNSIVLAFGVPDDTHSDYMMLTRVDHDGAVTDYEYEGALAYALVPDNTPITIGVRVKQILVKDGDSIKQCRSFSYESPSVSGESYPNLWDYVSLDVRRDTTAGPFNGVAFLWSFSVHEGYIGPGSGLEQTYVNYGQVTENVHQSPTDSSGTRTVFYYDTESANRRFHQTEGRFPSYADSIFNDPANLVIGALNTKRVGYMDNGPTSPALLLRKDSYRRTPSGIEEPLSSEIYSYMTFGATEILVDYQVLETIYDGILAGHVFPNCLYHYPVTADRKKGRAPSRIIRVNYHHSGNDTTVVDYTYVPRITMDTPIRNDTLTICGSDGIRRVRKIYADTWPDSTPPSWVISLAARHSLQESLTQEYEHLDNAGNVLTSLVDERQYDSFSIPGNWTALMPSVRRELTDGFESWREEVFARDSLGNPTCIKERGRPQLSITWGYNGLYPTSITAGTGQTTLTTSYTWSPGIGLTSITEPTGTTTTYSYDTAGRLSEVRDYNGSIKENYTYSLLNMGNNLRSIRHKTFRDAYGILSTEDVSWWNTLGMKIQDIAICAGGNGEDLVHAYEGDCLLHDDVYAWLPYPITGSQGSYQANAPSTSIAYHNSSNAFFYKGYEMSTRNRVECTRLPGYGSPHENVISDDVRAGMSRLLWADGYGVISIGAYMNDEVLEEKYADADGRVQLSLKDRFGTLLATEKKSADGTSATIRTRFVYDNKDRLRAVIGDGIALTDTLSMWRYSYDSIGRISSKGIPGSEREFYSYDNDDRIVSVRRGQALTETEYDDLGRVLKVWLTVSGGQRTLLEEHRWDSRDQDARAILGYHGRMWLFGTEGPTEGLETYVKKAVTDGNGGFSPYYLESASVYDAEGRPTYIVTRYRDNYHFSTAHVVSKEYDFSGNVIRTEESCKTGFFNGQWDSLLLGDANVEQITRTTYDLQNRPVQVISSLNGISISAVSDTTTIVYDALGRQSQIVSSSGGPSVISTDTYTLQGWQQEHVVGVGAFPLFSESLYYDTIPETGGYGVSWTGLVTAQYEAWTDPALLPTLIPVKKYYRYDAFGRLDKAKRKEGDGPDWVDPCVENIFNYDGRGNILRKDSIFGQLIQPYEQYSYLGDRIVSKSIVEVGRYPVVLSTDTFTHDSFGRMTHDGSGNFDIAYNHMDLPEKISRNDTILVKYLYLADGMKTGAINNMGEGLEYRGSLTFRRNSRGGITFESAPFVAGRMTSDGIRYHVKDHLGSVRAVIDGSTGDILEASDYSAYGTRIQPQLPPGVSAQISNANISLPFRHHFTGQEEQTGLTSPGAGSSASLSLPYTDFGARHYSPTLSRWLVPDPLSEKYYDWSPYVYCSANPINVVDPNGMVVVPKGEDELCVILNTLPEDAREYVRINEDGAIDKELFNQYDGDSINYNSLRELVNSDMTVTFSLADSFTCASPQGETSISQLSYCPPDEVFMDSDIEFVSGLTTGESGNYGKTLFPDRAGYQNSTTNAIEIYLHPSLSTIGRAESFSHEAYGHALLYLRNGYDHNGAGHYFKEGLREGNIVLKSMILQARRETINNIKQY